LINPSPLKFSSWHTFVFSSSKSSNVNLLVQERSRSVKALFAVQRRPTASYGVDNGATFFDTSYNSAGSVAAGYTAGTLQSYQYRIGGRYFPAAPVQTAAIGASSPNGGAEAYLELEKALNIVGDYRLSTNVNAKTWALPPVTCYLGGSATATLGGYVTSVLNEYDYTMSITTAIPGKQPFATLVESPTGSTAAVLNAFGGSLGSASFCMATNLETSNGVEISGLNAEEQSDIALIAQWHGSQTLGNSLSGAAVTEGGASNLEIYSYYDAMIILRENNVIYSFILGFGIDSIMYVVNIKWLLDIMNFN
jgi:hypothetical protein